jgi:hypothetical protein
VCAAADEFPSALRSTDVTQALSQIASQASTPVPFVPNTVRNLLLVRSASCPFSHLYGGYLEFVTEPYRYRSSLSVQWWFTNDTS